MFAARLQTMLFQGSERKSSRPPCLFLITSRLDKILADRKIVINEASENAINIEVAVETGEYVRRVNTSNWRITEINSSKADLEWLFCVKRKLLIKYWVFWNKESKSAKV